MTLSEREALVALGTRLRKYREDMNLTMQELANLADVDLSQVTRIESGKVNPQYVSLLRLAIALDLDIDFKKRE